MDGNFIRGGFEADQEQQESSIESNYHTRNKILGVLGEKEASDIQLRGVGSQYFVEPHTVQRN